jgi:tetratricopeptide (TPR) repeat protein
MSSETAAAPALAVPAHGKPTPVQRHQVAAVLLIAVCAAYANHFLNTFHFDDFHTVTGNPTIRSLANIPSFFTDVKTSSILPPNRAWRPLVTASFAVDYWIGEGLNPIAFHTITFILYLSQVALLFLLFEQVFEAARPGEGNRMPAAFGAACYGLHPVCAETVNYVSQRAELYSTLGVVAALYLYIVRPEWRRYGVYLIPLAAAQLSKAPALVFPGLLFTYVYLFERREAGRALRSVAPSLLLSTSMAVLLMRMTPPSFVAGATSPAAYRLTQPYVALRYFESFFLPIRLSADTDLSPLASAMQPEAVAGFAFLAAMGTAAVLCSWRQLTAPIGFGLWWFLLTLVPTSFFALAEVENDHRMFFPFVGLGMSVAWSLTLALGRAPRRVVAPVALALLAVCAYGTNRRNEVWKDESSLWRDVTLKSPRNGRGLMNYGLTLMTKGDTMGALDYFERALKYTPNYDVLEINLGIANGQLHREPAAEQHFQRAMALAPRDALPHYYYARWLDSRGRGQDGLLHARIAEGLNPSNPDAQNLIASIEARINSRKEELARLERAASTQPTAENYLNLSLRYHQLGRYDDCIRVARKALEYNPAYAEAYNNIAAGYESLGQWDEAIRAAREALRIKPDFTLARNNLAWSEAQKMRQVTPEEK